MMPSKKMSSGMRSFVGRNWPRLGYFKAHRTNAFLKAPTPSKAGMVPKRKAPIRTGKSSTDESCEDRLAAIQTIPHGSSPLIAPKVNKRGATGSRPALLESRSKGRIHEPGNRYSTARYIIAPKMRLIPSINVPFDADNEMIPAFPSE